MAEAAGIDVSRLAGRLSGPPLKAEDGGVGVYGCSGLAGRLSGPPLKGFMERRLTYATKHDWPDDCPALH